MHVLTLVSKQEKYEEDGLCSSTRLDLLQVREVLHRLMAERVIDSPCPHYYTETQVYRRSAAVENVSDFPAGNSRHTFAQLGRVDHF